MDRILGTKTQDLNFVLHVTLETLDGEQVLDPQPILIGRVETEQIAEACEVDTDRGTFIENTVYAGDVYVQPCVRTLRVLPSIIEDGNMKHAGAWVHGPEDAQGNAQGDGRLQMIWKRIQQEAADWVDGRCSDVDLEEFDS